MPELVALVRRHPLRERLRAQLMLALYRSGRQAEALERFDEGRRKLGEELGLEPGTRLRRLQADILTQDPGARLRSASCRRAGGARAAPAPPVRSPWPREAGWLPRWRSDAESLRRRRGTRLRRRRGGTLVRLDAAPRRVERRVSVGSTPGAISVGEGAIWAVDVDGQTISRVDPGSHEVGTFATARRPRTSRPVRVRSGWRAAARCREPSTPGPVGVDTRAVDPAARTVRARIRLPQTGGATTELTEDHVAVERDAVWAIAPDYAVVRIDPRTNRIVRTIRGLRAQAVAAGDAGVWVLGFDGTIARIDRGTNRIAARDRVRASAVASLAVGGGAAWVSAPGDGTVWRVQPGPRLVMRTIDVGAGVGDLSFGAGSLWAVNPLRGTLTRIDPDQSRGADRSGSAGRRAPSRPATRPSGLP